MTTGRPKPCSTASHGQPGGSWGDDTGYVVVVYDALAERKLQNPADLPPIPPPVVEGRLGEARLRRFQADGETTLDLVYSNVLVYIFLPGMVPQRLEPGAVEPFLSDVL